MEDVEIVRDILKRFNITALYQGYDYTIHAVKITLKDRDCLRFVTKQLYPEIAREYNTSWKCVERDIRTVVEIVWKNGGKEFFYEFTGEYIESRPRNAKFLELMAEYIMYSKSMDKDLKEKCRDCPIVKNLEKDVMKLEKEVRTLNGTINWMHDLIWELMKKRKKDGHKEE